MLPDYHIHTPLCKHADGEVQTYRQMALTRHIPEMAFTDHAPAPDGFDPVNRMLLDQFPIYHDMISSLSTTERPPVLFGVEADYYDNAAAFLEPWLEQQAFDIVLGSVHVLTDWGIDDPNQAHIWDSVDIRRTWKIYFNMIGKLADTHLYDVVGHLDLPKKFGHRLPDKVIKEFAQPALDRIADAGMAIEINSSGLRKPIREIYPSPLLLSLAHERDIPICFGSDAHTPEDVGYCFDQSLALAKDVGYTQSVRFSQRQKRPVTLP